MVGTVKDGVWNYGGRGKIVRMRTWGVEGVDGGWMKEGDEPKDNFFPFFTLCFSSFIFIFVDFLFFFFYLFISHSSLLCLLSSPSAPLHSPHRHPSPSSTPHHPFHPTTRNIPSPFSPPCISSPHTPLHTPHSFPFSISFSPHPPGRVRVPQ